MVDLMMLPVLAVPSATTLQPDARTGAGCLVVPVGLQEPKRRLTHPGNLSLLFFQGHWHCQWHGHTVKVALAGTLAM